MKTLGLLIDCGRKFWPLDDLKRAIDLCQDKGFSYFQMHFSDNEGLRLETKRYPECLSDDYISQDELKDLLHYAADKGITVIPEFDTPGHLEQILEVYPQFGLEVKEGDSTRRTALDLANQEGVNMIHRLLEEYVGLFPDAPYVHLGADEFIPFSTIGNYPSLVEASKAKYGPEASGLEVYVDYVNDICQAVTRLGKTPRVWNDGFYRTDVTTVNQLTQDVEICYWTRWDKNMASLDSYFDRGYKVVNFNDNCFYFVLGEMAGYSYPTYETVKAKWLPNRFAQSQESDHPYETVFFSVWADKADALTTTEILTAIAGPMQAMQEINQENS